VEEGRLSLAEDLKDLKSERGWEEERRNNVGRGEEG
jgi:hypothetical protein